MPSMTQKLRPLFALVLLSLLTAPNIAQKRQLRVHPASLDMKIGETAQLEVVVIEGKHGRHLLGR